MGRCSPGVLLLERPHQSKSGPGGGTVWEVLPGKKVVGVKHSPKGEGLAAFPRGWRCKTAGGLSASLSTAQPGSSGQPWPGSERPLTPKTGLPVGAQSCQAEPVSSGKSLSSKGAAIRRSGRAATDQEARRGGLSAVWPCRPASASRSCGLIATAEPAPLLPLLASVSPTRQVGPMSLARLAVFL